MLRVLSLARTLPPPQNTNLLALVPGLAVGKRDVLVLDHVLLLCVQAGIVVSERGNDRANPIQQAETCSPQPIP